jgi:hypothetical protein
MSLLSETSFALNVKSSALIINIKPFTWCLIPEKKLLLKEKMSRSVPTLFLRNQNKVLFAMLLYYVGLIWLEIIR